MDNMTPVKDYEGFLHALALIPIKDQVISDAKAILLLRATMPHESSKSFKQEILKTLQVSEYRWNNATNRLKEMGILNQNNRDFEWHPEALIEADHEDLDDETRESLMRGIEQMNAGDIHDLGDFTEFLNTTDVVEDDKDVLQDAAQKAFSGDLDGVMSIVSSLQDKYEIVGEDREKFFGEVDSLFSNMQDADEAPQPKGGTPIVKFSNN